MSIALSTNGDNVTESVPEFISYITRTLTISRRHNGITKINAIYEAKTEIVLK